MAEIIVIYSIACMGALALTTALFSVGDNWSGNNEEEPMRSEEKL